MQFRYSPTAPQARKYRVMIREKGLLGKVEETPTVITKEFAGMPAGDPMRQASAVIDAGGLGYTEMPSILQLLENAGAGAKILPEREADRMNALRQIILADGALDIGVELVASAAWRDGEEKTYSQDRWRKAVLAGLDALEQLAPKAEPLTIGVISVACALTWFDRKLPDLAWKPSHPKLAALQTALEKRPSFKDTLPA
jgi:glutathione S-transferase